MTLVGITPQMSQQDQDRRSLALHRLVAEKVRGGPAIVGRAAEVLARWRADEQGTVGVSRRRKRSAPPSMPRDGYE